MGMSWHPWALGSIFGALMVAFFVTPTATVALAPYWLFALGGLFVLVTLLLPRGVVGTIQELWSQWQERRLAAKREAAPPPDASPRPAE